VIIGFSSCRNQYRNYLKAVGEYERYQNGWYEKANLTYDGEILLYEIDGQQYEMVPQNKLFDQFFVYIDNDTLNVRLKKSKGKVDQLIVTNGSQSYLLKKTYLKDREGIFNRVQLKEDFRQLQNIINRLHPSLHGTISRHEFNQLCHQAHKAIDTSMRVEDFYRIVGPIVTSLGCGHTSIWMPRNYWDKEASELFPLELAFLKDGICLKKDMDRSNSIPFGSEIISVNDVPIRNIAASLKPYISADAFSNGYRKFRLNKRFSYLYALHYGYFKAFDVAYKDPFNGESYTCNCGPVSVKNIRDNFRFSPVLKLDFLDPEVLAIIRISSFYYIDNNKFCEFIDDAFEKIHNAGTSNLIVDIRGNDGGCPRCASHLLSYLANESFTYFEKPFGKFSELAEPVTVQEKRFIGKLFILIDGGCFSTSGQFCSLLKFHKIGRLIGSETGGAHICNESKKIIELKNTRLQLQVARSSFGTAVEGFSGSHGIRPDDLIEPTIRDFQKGLDPVMNYAIMLSSACKH
jgi:hypothetical protein